MRYDTIIAGGGLAGAAAALSLSAAGRVLVVEATLPAAGASGAAAGLVNPLMGRRARPVWRMDDALAAFHTFLDRAGARPLLRPGLLRPAADPEQVRFFRETARRHPRLAAWCPPEAIQARYPLVRAPYGALALRDGGALSVPAFVRALLAAAVQAGATLYTGTRLTGWHPSRGHLTVTVATARGTASFQARRLLLALGAGYTRHPALAGLKLHLVKGQTVRLALPPGAALEALPPLAGQGYVVAEGRTLVAGTTYEHHFTDPRPSARQSSRIREKVAAMLPLAREARVLGASAGLRVNVPGTRLPLLGPLPGHPGVWVFTGLGSKGLLMAPLLARDLPHYLTHPEAIPEEIHVRNAS